MLLKAVDKGFQVLFGRQAPDMQYHGGVGSCPPFETQQLATAVRAEQLRIDPARDDVQVAKAESSQIRTHLLGGHHGQHGPVVKFAQVGNDGLLQPADAVVQAVGVEVGAEIGANRNPELMGNLERRPAERPSVTIWTISGRCSVHSLISIRLAGKPIFRLG